MKGYIVFLFNWYNVVKGEIKRVSFLVLYLAINLVAKNGAECLFSISWREKREKEDSSRGDAIYIIALDKFLLILLVDTYLDFVRVS